MEYKIEKQGTFRLQTANCMRIGGEPAKNETVGKIESKLGSVTGCEGMVDEGKERQS